MNRRGFFLCAPGLLPLAATGASATGELLSEKMERRVGELHNEVLSGVLDASRFSSLAEAFQQGGAIFLPAGVYEISETIEVDLSRTRRPGFHLWSPGAARIQHVGQGSALRLRGTHKGTASPDSVNESVRDRERKPVIEGIEIRGSFEQDGIELVGTHHPLIVGCLLTELRHGLILRGVNRNLIVAQNHFYHLDGYGIWYDNVSLHQSLVTNNHISYCRCGFYLLAGNCHDIHILGNDIEKGETSRVKNENIEGLVRIETRGSDTEGVVITGNTIEGHGNPKPNIELVGVLDNPYRLRNLVVTSNSLNNSTPDYSVVEIHGASNITVGGNAFKNDPGRLVHLKRCRGFSIHGNCSVDRTKGILLSDGTEQGAIHGNVLQSAAPALEAAGSFVRDLVVTGNTFHGDDKAGETALIHLAPGPGEKRSDIVLTGNLLHPAGKQRSAFDGKGASNVSFTSNVVVPTTVP